jgi:predicted nucleotidyltransferase
MSQWTAEQIEASRQYHRERDAKRRAEREAYRHEWLERVRTAIRQVAPTIPAVRRAYLFGSLMQAGRFRPDSDIDVAVECSDLEQESLFWRGLERALQREVDVRPYVEPITQAVAWYGELVYERQDGDPVQEH